jgi:glycosyltransferase involved in cell wall biosynthesis
MKLGVYFELPYRRDERGYSAEIAFVRFALAVGRHFDQLTLLGRVDPTPGRSPYAVPDDVELAALPHYETMRDIHGLLTSLPGTLRAVWRALEPLDVVWSIGPHPMSIPVALLGLARRKRVVLGVRQDFPRYIRYRLGSRRWAPALAAAGGLDTIFRLLGRRLPTVVVGPELARRYSGGAPLLEITVSLIASADVASEPAVRPLNGHRPVELLSVGRLDPEKAPDVLLEMLHALKRGAGGPWRLSVVGDGPLEASLRSSSRKLGESVRFLGHVPNGPELFALYRASDIFVHTARTEGLPQVLIEAQACGLPIVATDVGGVGGALAAGTDALLVAPEDPEALAASVRRLAEDQELRERFARRGIERAAELTIEREAERVAAFLKPLGGTLPPPAG